VIRTINKKRGRGVEEKEKTKEKKHKQYGE